MRGAFDPGGLGRSTEEREFKVEAPRTIAYAAATNDTNERHISGELAPPVFAIVPVWDVMTAAAGFVTPPDAFTQVMHSQQDMRFFRPIAPGDVLRSKATPVYVAVRGVGTTVAVRTRPGAEGERRVQGVLESTDDDGIVVAGRRIPYADVDRARTVFEWGGAKAKPGHKARRAS